MNPVKIALAQIEVGADISENVRKIRNFACKAADEGAKIVAFPECAISGYPPHIYKRPDCIDIKLIQNAVITVSAIAKSANIWMIVGAISLSDEGFLNTAYTISNDGTIIHVYHKQHLMPEDRIFFAKGNQLSLFDFESLKCGVAICYDARFPELFRKMRDMGAHAIFIVSNALGKDLWKMPVLEGTYRCRAAENSCYIAAVNSAGPMQMAVSGIYDCLGVELAKASPNSECIIYADVDIEQTHSGCYFDKRTDLYEVAFKGSLR